jgi:hypothetical protein
MDQTDDIDETAEEIVATAPIGEHLRTWRKFLSVVRWSAGALAVLLIALLVFCTHG